MSEINFPNFNTLLTSRELQAKTIYDLFRHLKDVEKDSEAYNALRQEVQELCNEIRSLDPSMSEEEAIQALAAKQAIVEADLADLGPKIDQLDEQLNGESEVTSYTSSIVDTGYVATSGAISSHSSYKHSSAISIDSSVKRIVAKVVASNAFGGLVFSKSDSLPTSSAQANARVVSVISGTGSNAGANEVIDVDAATIATAIAAGALYVYIGVYANNDYQFDIYTESDNGLVKTVEDLQSGFETLEDSVADITESVKQIDGGSDTIHSEDSAFSEGGFLNTDGSITTNSAWNHTPAISLDGVIGIKALAELGNPYGGGVNFYSSSTIAKSSFVSNIGSNTGTNNGEITITQQQIEAAIANGATHFSVTKNNNYTSSLDVTYVILSLDERFNDVNTQIAHIESLAVQRIEIKTTDSETEIYAKLKAARDTGNCDVVWEFGTYNFTDTLYTYMKTLGEHRLVGAYELPLGGGCRYYFNNSTLIFEITTYDGSCNGFGCVRKNCGNYSLHDGTIIATNLTYCVHDEGQGEDGTYIHEYHNMTFKYLTDGSQLGKCIGGGTGKNGTAIIDQCIFLSTDNTDCDCDVSWHGLNNTDVSAFFKLVITNSYLSKKVSIDNLSANQYATLLYCGNSHATAPNDRTRWTKYEAGNTTRT